MIYLREILDEAAGIGWSLVLFFINLVGDLKFFSFVLDAPASHRLL